MLTKDDIRRLIEGGGTEIAASTTQENDDNTQERGATTQEADDVAPKPAVVAPKTGEFAAKTSENAAKNDGVTPKTDDVAPKAGSVAPKTKDYDAVDKKLRITLCDVLKVKQLAAREAIFGKCIIVYFSMKEEIGISKRALAVKLNMPLRSISRYQALLVQAGLLTHIGPTNGGEWKFSI